MDIKIKFNTFSLQLSRQSISRGSFSFFFFSSYSSSLSSTRLFTFPLVMITNLLPIHPPSALPTRFDSLNKTNELLETGTGQQHEMKENSISNLFPFIDDALDGWELYTKSCTYSRDFEIQMLYSCIVVLLSSTLDRGKRAKGKSESMTTSMRSIVGREREWMLKIIYF